MELEIWIIIQKALGIIIFICLIILAYETFIVPEQQKTICLQCGKKGYQTGKPCYLKDDNGKEIGKELASHIICSKKCAKEYEVEFLSGLEKE